MLANASSITSLTGYKQSKQATSIQTIQKDRETDEMGMHTACELGLTPPLELSQTERFDSQTDRWNTGSAHRV